MKSLKTFIIALFISGLTSCQPGKEAAKPPVRLGPEIQQLAEEILGPLESPVTIQLTLGGDGETMAEETRALLDLIARTSPEVNVNRLYIATHPDAISLGVSHGPIFEMKGQAPGIMRYYGFPERKEIRPFFEGILSASGQLAKMPTEAESYVSALDEKILIRVFTTPD